MIEYRRGLFRVAELWFDEHLSGTNADIVRYLQRSHPIPGADCAPFHTTVLDLSADSDLLLANMKRETRYEIRRATEKDHLEYEMLYAADSRSLAEFRSFYDQCVKLGNLPPVRNARLQKFADAGALSLSCVRGQAGAALVWHAYYCTAARVRLLHSASLRCDLDSAQRSLLGRANRYHHWHDALAFKTRGVYLYDFGGWHTGDDRKLLAINAFKAAFGGRVVQNYDCVQGFTRLGKAALWLYTQARLRASKILSPPLNVKGKSGSSRVCDGSPT
jgi:hypothetical protein